ncbi:MAG: hypothetical protein MUP09_06725, partial [Thiovulaceae bacterium]|nr:hypothetical protein [Sulfurimonadaceae bacterium]
MRYLSALFILLLLSPLFGAEAATHQNIIVGSFLKQSEADKEREKFENWVNNSPQIEVLRGEDPFYTASRQSGSYFIVVLEPIESSELLQKLYTLVKPVYQDAFIGRIQSKALLAEYAKAADTLQIPTEVSKESRADSDNETGETEGVTKRREVSSLFSEQYLLPAALFLFSVLIYFLVRRRKEARHVKKIEDANTSLNSDNTTLSSENR